MILPRTVRRLMPAIVDALAALFCGAGVFLMVINVKPVPDLLAGFLTDLFSYIWATLLLIGSITAAAGSVLRAIWRHHPTAGYFLEYIGWPTIAWCAFIFAIAAGVELGWIDSLLTIGFAGFVAATCVGQWWRLREAKIAAIHRLGKKA